MHGMLLIAYCVVRNILQSYGGLRAQLRSVSIWGSIFPVRSGSDTRCESNGVHQISGSVCSCSTEFTAVY